MVSFNLIPSSTRVPFVYVEIDPSKAQQGPTILDYRAAIIGQKLPSTPVAENDPFLATSADEVGAAFGMGSMIHAMAIAWFAVNKQTETWFIGVEDAGGGTDATYTLTVSGPATAAGTVYLYVAGRRIAVGVSSGDSATAIAAAIDAAIQASDDYPFLPVTSGVASNVVTLTAKNAGTQGNYIDVRLNYQTGEFLPAGAGVVIAPGVAGATDPALTGAITALAGQQYHILAVGLNDATSHDAIRDELVARYDPSVQEEGHAFFAVTDTFANLVTYGSARNSEHTTVLGLEGPLSPPWELAASTAAIAARYGQNDPARPFKYLELAGMVGPALVDRFTLAERETLLKNGISTAIVQAGGNLVTERLITTFQTNASGAKSTAFLDLTTKLTLMYLRFDFRTSFATTFPRHKLADDGTRFGPGQPVMTPKIGRAFAITRFRGWEELGLVEGAEQFMRDLIVERNTQDPNRLDFLLPPDLINQLQVAGASIQFLL